MSQPLLSLEGVSKSFGSLSVLNNIDLEVREGTILSLMGSSGCGKTTLARVLVGLEKAESGTIQVGRLQRHEIGFIFQKAFVFPWLTVRGNIEFGLRERGNDVGKAVEDIIAFLGLEEFTEYLPSQLSGGMLQRVAIGRAAILRPRLLIMDEPFHGLDFVTKHRLYGYIAELNQMLGISIILVTHDIREAAEVSKEVVILTRRPARIYKKLKGVGQPAAPESTWVLCQQIETALEEAAALPQGRGAVDHD